MGRHLLGVLLDNVDLVAIAGKGKVQIWLLQGSNLAVSKTLQAESRLQSYSSCLVLYWGYTLIITLQKYRVLTRLEQWKQAQKFQQFMMALIKFHYLAVVAILSKSQV